MKLLYIANARIPTEKAHGLQVMKMCEAFARAGHSVTLVVPWRFGRLDADPFEYYEVRPIFRIARVFSVDFIGWFGSVAFFLQVATFALASFLYALFARADIIYSRDEVALLLLTLLPVTSAWEVHTKKLNWFVRRLFSRVRVM